MRRRRKRREGGERRRKRREGEGKPDCRSCSLLIVADNSFYEEVININEQN